MHILSMPKVCITRALDHAISVSVLVYHTCVKSFLFRDNSKKPCWLHQLWSTGQVSQYANCLHMRHDDWHIVTHAHWLSQSRNEYRQNCAQKEWKQEGNFVGQTNLGYKHLVHSYIWQLTDQSGILSIGKEGWFQPCLTGWSTFISKLKNVI